MQDHRRRDLWVIESTPCGSCEMCQWIAGRKSVRSKFAFRRKADLGSWQIYIILMKLLVHLQFSILPQNPDNDFLAQLPREQGFIKVASTRGKPFIGRSSDSENKDSSFSIHHISQEYSRCSSLVWIQDIPTSQRLLLAITNTTFNYISLLINGIWKYCIQLDETTETTFSTAFAKLIISREDA